MKIIISTLIVMYLIFSFILMEINAYCWTEGFRAMYIVLSVVVISIIYKVYDARVR